MSTQPQLHLKDALNARTVKAKVFVSSWEQAVEAAGMVMVQANLVEPRYIDAMKKTLRDLGPYSVIAPGIAMPHARPEDGVIQTGFSLVTLEKPVAFGNAENDPVDLVFAFGATDKETHIQALKDLSDVISKPKLVERIRTAENKEEIIDLLHG